MSGYPEPNHLHDGRSHSSSYNSGDLEPIDTGVSLIFLAALFFLFSPIFWAEGGAVLGFTIFGALLFILGIILDW